MESNFIRSHFNTAIHEIKKAANIKIKKEEHLRIFKISVALSLFDHSFVLQILINLRFITIVYVLS